MLYSKGVGAFVQIFIECVERPRYKPQPSWKLNFYQADEYSPRQMFKYVCAAGSQVDKTACDGRALPSMETKEGFSVCLFVCFVLFYPD